jgi:small ligand-binding sensory domain FIST
MRTACAVSTRVGSTDSATELAEGVRTQLAGASSDLCILIASSHFEEHIQALADALAEALTPGVFVGATAEAVIANDTEYEGQAAAVLWAASLPGVRMRSFHLSGGDIEQFEDEDALRDHIHTPADVDPTFLMLGDPFTINPLVVLRALEEAYPGRPAFGGMASGAEKPGQSVLIFDGHAIRYGLVGVAMWGDLEIETIVSQGCRPIGRHLVVTRADHNVIHSLGGKPPLGVAHELLMECSEYERELAHGGLLVGCVINEYKSEFQRGDFIIRNPLHWDRDSGTLAINDLVRTGQTIQFHVRDADSAAEDLVRLLQRRQPAPPAGALLFTCNGRGRRLFPDRHHDARTVSRACENPPLAGFFCAGEIGPVGKRNFLHGYTASIALFRPARESHSG